MWFRGIIIIINTIKIYNNNNSRSSSSIRYNAKAW